MTARDHEKKTCSLYRHCYDKAAFRGVPCVPCQNCKNFTAATLEDKKGERAKGYENKKVERAPEADCKEKERFILSPSFGGVSTANIHVSREDKRPQKQAIDPELTRKERVITVMIPSNYNEFVQFLRQ